MTLDRVGICKFNSFTAPVRPFTPLPWQLFAICKVQNINLGSIFLKQLKPKPIWTCNRKPVFASRYKGYFWPCTGTVAPWVVCEAQIWSFNQFGIQSLQTSPLEVNFNIENQSSICRALEALFTALRIPYFTIVTPLQSGFLGPFA